MTSGNIISQKLGPGKKIGIVKVEFQRFLSRSASIREGLKFATTKPDSRFTADDSRSSVGRKIIPLTLNDQDRAVLEEEQAILREGKMLEEQYGYCGYS